VVGSYNISIQIIKGVDNMSTLALWIAGTLMGNIAAFKFALLLMELSKLDKDEEDTD
jgi:hypothetical protein